MVRLAAQDPRVAGQHGLGGRGGAYRPRHGRRSARPRDGRPRLRDVEPGEGRREPGEVALAADLAVADDVDARSLHVTDDQTRRVVLSLLAEVLRYTPERRLRHPRPAAREQ